MSLLLTLLSATASVPSCLPPETPSGVLVVAARRARRAGDADRASECLEQALLQNPDNPFLWKEQGILRMKQGKIRSALEYFERALRLGDPDPQTEVLRARMLSLLGPGSEAAEIALATQTTEGLLVAAALDNESAGYELAPTVGEPTERGAMAALVLAGHALRTGRARAAETLASAAQDSAEAAAISDLAQAAEDLRERAQNTSTWSFAARLRAGIEHDSNPSFLSSESFRQPGLRTFFTAAGAARGHLGPVQLQGALRADQHFFLTDRDTLSAYDNFTLGLRGSAFLPVSRDPSFVRIGVQGRFVDAFGDRFQSHYVTEFEGGPALALRLGPRIDFRLAFHGIISDFIDFSPADDTLSTVNRDRVGQRALLTLLFHLDEVVIAADAAFFRDDTDGDAFDMVGGTIGSRVYLWPSPGLGLWGGVGLSLREVGPVGDAVTGPAALRTEFRVALDTGLRFSLFPPVDLVVENRFRTVLARTNHGFSYNVVSLGLEVGW